MHLLFLGIAAAVVTGIFIYQVLLLNQHHLSRSPRECRCFVAKRADIIRKLTRQCSRWLVAAQQDESPIIATLHLQYGIGYLWAIKDIIESPDEFFAATQLDYKEFESNATQLQDIISRRIVVACPSFAGEVNAYFARIAGEI